MHHAATDTCTPIKNKRITYIFVLWAKVTLARDEARVKMHETLNNTVYIRL